MRFQRPSFFSRARRHLLAAAALGLCAALPLQASAQEWPTRAIRIIVPYTPGGGNDIMARIIAEKLAPALGQPVVVENRAGAGAIVGTEYVINSDPDGYVLLFAASGPMVFNQALIPNLSYNTLKDLAPITMAGRFPLVLAVKEDFVARNFNELVDFSKKNPDKSNYSYPAASFQLGMELLKARTGLQALNVPYKGSAPSINAVLSGDVQMTFVDIGPAAAMLKAGRLRGIAVTSKERLEAYPEIPTLIEQGVDFTITLWSGLFAPAKTPEHIINRLYQEVAKIVAMPDVKERFAKFDITAESMPPTEFRQLIADEIALWTQVAKDNNLQEQR